VILRVKGHDDEARHHHHRLALIGTCALAKEASLLEPANNFDNCSNHGGVRFCGDCFEAHAPLALSDTQLRTVMTALGPLDPSKRAVALGRVRAQLRVSGIRPPSDADLKSAIAAALMHGIVHHSAA
jgi:hypothetical protein